MNYWSLLLLVCLAVFQPITSEQNLIDGRDQSCDPFGDRLAYGHRFKTEDRRLSRDYRDQHEVRRSLLARTLIDGRIAAASSERQVTGFRREIAVKFERSDIRREAEIRQDRLANGRENRVHIARERQNRENTQEHFIRNNVRKDNKENLTRSTRAIHPNRDRAISEQRFARSSEIRQNYRRFVHNDFNREERSRREIRERIARSTVRQDDRTYQKREQRNSMDASRSETGHRDAEERERVRTTRQTRSIFQRATHDVAQRSVSDQIRGRDSRTIEIHHRSVERRMLEQREHRKSIQSRSVDRTHNIRDEVRRTSDSHRVARDESRSTVENDRKVTHLSRSRSVADRVKDARDETRRSLEQIRNVRDADVALSRVAVERVRDARETRKSCDQIRNVRDVSRSRPAVDHAGVARDESRRSVNLFRNVREVQNARHETRRSIEPFRNVRDASNSMPAEDRVRISRDFSRRSMEQVLILRDVSRSRPATDRVRDSREESRRSLEQARNVRDESHSRSATDRVRDARGGFQRSLEPVRNVRDISRSKPATERVRDSRYFRRSLEEARIMRDAVHSRSATDRDARDISRRSREQARNVRDAVHSRAAVDRVRVARDDSRRSLEQDRDDVRDFTRFIPGVNRVNRGDTRRSLEQIRSVRDESRRLIGRIRDNVRDELRVLTHRAGQERVRDTNNERERQSTISMPMNRMQLRERPSRDRTMMLRRGYFEGTTVERRLTRESQRVRNADARARETRDRAAESRNRERVMERQENKLSFRNTVRYAKERQHLDVTREMKVSPIRADNRITNNLERSIDSRFPVNTQVSDIRKYFVSMIKEKEEPHQKLDTLNWHYFLYALQGIYLCGMIIQLLSLESEKKKSRAFWWVPRFNKLLKVD